MKERVKTYLADFQKNYKSWHSFYYTTMYLKAISEFREFLCVMEKTRPVEDDCRFRQLQRASDDMIFEINDNLYGVPDEVYKDNVTEGYKKLCGYYDICDDILNKVGYYSSK